MATAGAVMASTIAWTRITVSPPYERNKPFWGPDTIHKPQLCECSALGAHVEFAEAMGREVGNQGGDFIGSLVCNPPLVMRIVLLNTRYRLFDRNSGGF
jgi:hypothetical protein